MRIQPPRISIAIILLAALCNLSFAQATVGKWERIIIEVQASNYSGNPFELIVDATFTHSTTGTSLILPAFYAGNDTWRFGFMPTRIGTWNYEVSSSIAEIDGLGGTIEAVPSTSDGLLSADPANPRKWKFIDGSYILPIAPRMEFFFESASETEWLATVDFIADEMNGHIVDTRLQDESSSEMIVFEGRASDHIFDLNVWDRMERRMDALAARGLGAYIMFYADDTGKPQWSGQSATEALLIRYAVARLSGYPIVIWDTGIDIAEYRTQADINWFGEQIRRIDAYGHPVSSRIGGGSGKLYMDGRTYDSQGDRQAYIGEMTDYFENTSRPVAMTDSYHEDNPDRPEKNFEPEDIRRAMWKGVMAGGLGIFIRGSDGYFHIDSIRDDLESEQWIGLVNPFIDQKLGSAFGQMVPEAGLVSNGFCLADPARTKLLYWMVGENDRYDVGDGGDITLRLANVQGTYSAIWFDPRSGNESNAGPFNGGANHVVTPPSTDDWVLLLTNTKGVTRPEAIKDLRAE